MSRLAVIGAVSMGAQIAQQAALTGLDVSLQGKDRRGLVQILTRMVLC